MEDYNISFFKPKSDFSRKNRNLVLTLVIIWAVSVFGFQILLKILEKPVPEIALTEFNEVKTNVFAETASPNEMQVFLKSLINVANKNTVNKDSEKPIVEKAINWAVYSLVTDKNIASDKIKNIQNKKEEALNISDFSKYKEERLKIKELEKEFIVENFSTLSINKNDIRAEILTSVLTSDINASLTNEEKDQLPKIMDKFLIHNRSVLTDTTFIGFPFHYFYTAVFLLVLFVGICYVYAKQIERLNKQFGIDD